MYLCKYLQAAVVVSFVNLESCQFFIQVQENVSRHQCINQNTKGTKSSWQCAQKVNPDIEHICHEHESSAFFAGYHWFFSLIAGRQSTMNCPNCPSSTVFYDRPKWEIYAFYTKTDKSLVTLKKKSEILGYPWKYSCCVVKRAHRKLHEICKHRKIINLLLKTTWKVEPNIITARVSRCSCYTSCLLRSVRKCHCGDGII